MVFMFPYLDVINYSIPQLIHELKNSSGDNGVNLEAQAALALKSFCASRDKIVPGVRLAMEVFPRLPEAAIWYEEALLPSLNVMYKYMPDRDGIDTFALFGVAREQVAEQLERQRAYYTSDSRRTIPCFS
jgi:hypothetical protein